MGGVGRVREEDVCYMDKKSTGDGVSMEIGFIRTWSCGPLSDQRLKRSGGTKNTPLRLQARIYRKCVPVSVP